MKIRFIHDNNKNHWSSNCSGNPGNPVVKTEITKNCHAEEDKPLFSNAPVPALEEIDNEISALIGLNEVKEIIKEVWAFLKIQKRRMEYGLKAESLNLHMIFKGNPGTGKTTIARILGRIFSSLEVLPRGHVVEVERADLVGEYIGHTALKTREKLNQALGGILFVDEAYSLGRGGNNDFGKEAIDVLVKSMEDYRDQFVLILAGYRTEMESFLKLNPGLRSRFSLHVNFPDFTVSELLLIADKMVLDRNYNLSAKARQNLKRYLLRVTRERSLSFSNARFVRNLLEKSFRKQALRLVHQQTCSRRDLMVLLPQDLELEEY